MTIRSRLLFVLLPTMTLFIVIVATLFYFDWVHNILITAIICAFFLWLILFFIAKRISKPVVELKNLALAIAAGNYDKHIHVQGPKEIEELAGTLNTMSACLKEQITQIKENALEKELYMGEHECALLLKEHMVNKVIERSKNFPFHMRALSTQSNHPKGLLLTISGNQLSLYEAKSEGFAPIFDLLASMTKESFPSLQLTYENNKVNIQNKGMYPPLFWPNEQELNYIFIYNKEFHQEFPNEEAIKEWFEKILRHFAEDGLEAVSSMIEKELLFFSRKRNIDEDLQILCMKLKEE